MQKKGNERVKKKKKEKEATPGHACVTCCMCMAALREGSQLGFAWIGLGIGGSCWASHQVLLGFVLVSWVEGCYLAWIRPRIGLGLGSSRMVINK